MYFQHFIKIHIRIYLLKVFIMHKVIERVEVIYIMGYIKSRMK